MGLLHTNNKHTNSQYAAAALHTSLERVGKRDANGPTCSPRRKHQRFTRFAPLFHTCSNLAHIHRRRQSSVVGCAVLCDKLLLLQCMCRYDVGIGFNVLSALDIAVPFDARQQVLPTEPRRDVCVREGPRPVATFLVKHSRWCRGVA